eukprot:3544658-Amphidinium_carterae.1
MTTLLGKTDKDNTTNKHTGDSGRAKSGHFGTLSALLGCCSANKMSPPLSKALAPTARPKDSLVLSSSRS